MGDLTCLHRFYPDTIPRKRLHAFGPRERGWSISRLLSFWLSTNGYCVARNIAGYLSLVIETWLSNYFWNHNTKCSCYRRINLTNYYLTRSFICRRIVATIIHDGCSLANSHASMYANAIYICILHMYHIPQQYRVGNTPSYSSNATCITPPVALIEKDRERDVKSKSRRWRERWEEARGKTGKRMRNRAERHARGEADGKGVAGRTMVQGEGNKTHGTRMGRKTRTEKISRASIRLLFLPWQ